LSAPERHTGKPRQDIAPSGAGRPWSTPKSIAAPPWVDAAGNDRRASGCLRSANTAGKSAAPELNPRE